MTNNPVTSVFHFEDVVIDIRKPTDHLTKRIPWTKQQEQRRRNDASMRNRIGIRR